jgi:hypothetical protein
MYLCIISPTWGRGSDTMNCFTKKPSTIGDMGLRLAHGWIVLGIISSRSTPAVGEWRLDGRFRGFLMGCSWEFDAFIQRDFDVTPFNRISMGVQIMYCRLQCGFDRTIVEHHDLTWDSHFWSLSQASWVKLHHQGSVLSFHGSKLGQGEPYSAHGEAKCWFTFLDDNIKVYICIICIYSVYIYYIVIIYNTFERYQLLPCKDQQACSSFHGWINAEPSKPTSQFVWTKQHPFRGFHPHCWKFISQLLILAQVEFRTRRAFPAFPPIPGSLHHWPDRFQERCWT